MKIESGIPVPNKYPFPAMQVGDSFAVPVYIKRVAVTVAAARYGKRHDMLFTVRKTHDGSLRCWRLE